jgi:hypothetical protein
MYTFMLMVGISRRTLNVSPWYCLLCFTQCMVGLVGREQQQPLHRVRTPCDSYSLCATHNCQWLSIGLHQFGSNSDGGLNCDLNRVT